MYPPVNSSGGSQGALLCHYSPSLSHCSLTHQICREILLLVWATSEFLFTSPSSNRLKICYAASLSQFCIYGLRFSRFLLQLLYTTDKFYKQHSGLLSVLNASVELSPSKDCCHLIWLLPLLVFLKINILCRQRASHFTKCLRYH